MTKPLDIVDLLTNQRADQLILDVRSPSEYAQGHIPGAVNLPLFLDHERAEVGITYKSAGPGPAMEAGLQFVGPRMHEIVMRAKELASGNSVTLHCWRGGKRSESMGWLLDFAGIEVSVLRGGYKAYRMYLHEWIADTSFNLIILGGKTGSGKTSLLKALTQKGEQILDLEQLAHHKGSAFGWIGEEEQPTTEQFENDVFDVLRHMDVTRHIWVENESRTIGRVFIPELFWAKMKVSPLLHLEVPMSVRVQNLVDLYSAGDSADALIESFDKIGKRLGGQHLNAAVDAVKAGDYHTAAEVALTYYDKTYAYGLENSQAPLIERLEVSEHTTEEEIVDTLIEKATKLFIHESGSGSGV